MASSPALIKALLDPLSLPRLKPADQALVLRQAQQAGLLGFLQARIDDAGVAGKLADRLLAARVHATYHDHMIAWEMNRLARALADLPGPVILLKGAAYKALQLDLAAGRLASDVDLLVPRAQLSQAERLLLDGGWEPMKADQYEQHYYREWMHELPPLRHRERGTVVDLHHTILPPTARLQPVPEKLIAAAQPMADGPFHTFCPEDTLLHRATHLFYDGDLQNSLRELIDIHELLTLYMGDPDFLPRLVQRGRELDLARPLYYALWTSGQMLNTAVPEQIQKELADDAPALPVRWLMQRLLVRQLTPPDPDRPDRLQTIAGGLLFLRSHWLRMPPLMLARHLLTQVRRRGGIKTG